MNDFVKVMKEYREIVCEKVFSYLPKPNKEFKEYYDMINEYPYRKGKYFRPTLVLLGAELFGNDKNKVLDIASAMQLSEEWLLIHDDIEDQSDLRRGKPTLHNMFNKELALNAGDGLHIIMWSVFKDIFNNHDLITAKKMYDKMIDILFTTTEGQYLELSWIWKQRVDITEEEYYNMIYRKAGYYTVAGPLQLGAIASGAKEEEINNIFKFAIPFGKAFQIQDDVMNITSTSDKQGKERAGDVWEGKRTLLLIHLLENADEEEKRKIIEIYKKPREEKKEEEIEFILSLFEKYSSIDYAREIALSFSREAKEELYKNFKDYNKKALHLIDQAIDFVVNRDY